MNVKFQYITDVEGDLNYFKKQIRQSEIVQFTDLEENSIEFCTGNPHELFVFGGDICDRGDDITVTEMLVNLKESYPNRVFLIVGNRDANKTRFCTELPLDPNEILNENTNDIIAPAGATKTYKEYLGISHNSPINRLKWILECTMGAPLAFEYRRNELKKLMKKSEITDEEVYISYRQSVEHHGFMRRYLCLAQIGAIIGDTLIVHGGVNANNIGKVPDGFLAFESAEPNTSNLIKYSEANEWIEHLNQWYLSAIERWISSNNPSPNYNYSNKAPASPLMHIAIGPGSYFEGQLPVVGNFLKDRVTPWPLSEEAAIFLQKSGINRILAGHQPNSGMPLFLVGTTNSPIDDRSIQVFTCDTLYGNSLAYDEQAGANIRATDPRGTSIALVCVTWDSHRNTSNITINGVDGFNLKYEKTINFPRLNEEDHFIGRVLILDGKHFTVRINSSGLSEKPYVLTSTALDYSITYVHASEDELIEYDSKNYFITDNSIKNKTSFKY